MIRTRIAAESERTFAVAHWLGSWRDSYTAGLIPHDEWHRVMFPVLTRILERPGVSTFVACNTEADPDSKADLLGFITAESGRPYVYYVHVKLQYRRLGVAGRLFAAAGIDPRGAFEYACSTATTKQLGTKIPNAKWRPLVARNHQESHEQSERAAESATLEAVRRRDHHRR